MDSAKKQKLFPDFSHSESAAEKFSAPGEDVFQMNDSVWESLLRAPSFEAQLRVWIDKIASEKVLARTEEIVNQTREQARKQGYEAGMAEGKAAIEVAASKLHELTSQIASHKAELLSQHEFLFAETLTRVLENLAIPDVTRWVNQVEGLLAKFKAEFSEKARVQVMVGTDTWSQLQAAGLKSLEGLRWTIKLDESLKAGDIRIDFDGVGMQLSPQGLMDEWKLALQSEMKKTG